jgi:hypothetical protein
MKLYRVFLCFVFLGLLAGAAYSQTDPTVGLRGDGASTQINGTSFGGTFNNTCADTTPNPDTPATNCLDYYNNNQNSPDNAFVAIDLYLAPTLTYTCDNKLDPYFANCNVYNNVTFDGQLTTEVTFSGVGIDATGLCGGSGQDACQGILYNDHFSLFLDTGDMPTFIGVAEVVTTPEPASALLFVIGIGAIALFLKRA